MLRLMLMPAAYCLVSSGNFRARLIARPNDKMHVDSCSSCVDPGFLQRIRQLFQLRVLGLRSDEGGNVRVGVFPQREEILLATTGTWDHVIELRRRHLAGARHQTHCETVGLRATYRQARIQLAESYPIENS